MFSVICNVKKVVFSQEIGSAYTYYNCKSVLFERDDLVFHSSTKTTADDLKSIFEKNVVGGLAPYGYEDTYKKLNKVNNIDLIKYIALMEKNEGGMLEAGGSNYTLFNERLVHEHSEKVLFNKVNIFFNDDLVDSNLKSKNGNAYYLKEEYLEKAMQEALSSYKKASVDETQTPMTFQVGAVADQAITINFDNVDAMVTWSQYIANGMNYLFDTLSNYVNGESSEINDI